MSRLRQSNLARALQLSVMTVISVQLLLETLAGLKLPDKGNAES